MAEYQPETTVKTDLSFEQVESDLSETIAEVYDGLVLNGDGKIRSVTTTQTLSDQQRSELVEYLGTEIKQV